MLTATDRRTEETGWTASPFSGGGEPLRRVSELLGTRSEDGAAAIWDLPMSKTKLAEGFGVAPYLTC